jgi:dienelactone hydrolase
MNEERGNFFKQFITEHFILRPPTLNKKDFKQIMYNYVENLIFIKKNNIANSIDDYIPCLFYRKKESNNFFIYFHGNSENIFQIEYYGLDFRSYLEMNIILVEYPGYFLDNNNRSDPNTFFSNSLIVYDWIKSTFKVSDNQIFVCGRSLGTSPAIYLSSQRNPKALFLISAFTSIMNVGYDQVKILSEFCLEKIFNSINYIDNIKCPILFIHGKDDGLISYKHSIQLFQKVKKNNKNIEIEIRPGMDHNNFDLKKDIIDSILSFCNKYNLLNNQNNENMINNTNTIDVNNLYKIPYKIKQLLEAKIFDINEFEFEKEGKIEKKMFPFY